MSNLPPHILAAVDQTDALRAASDELLETIIDRVRRTKASDPDQPDALILAWLVADLRRTLTGPELAVELGLAVIRLAEQYDHSGSAGG